ncbi:hypothetical protein OESDEN_21044 [Oesophagostomum dentatum]|uniref:Uncharacterized protein n=1 Tax=Oesophagostomum dentatum TaxID=61180 RepID=A0A0B1S5Z6_OESDE|nr:hypothetical protein OESDEN_21044 [Oesophagostomum dentatum]
MFRAPLKKEDCIDDQAGVQRRGGVQLNHSPRRSVKSRFCSEPGGALLLQQAMELEYPRFIGESSKTPKTSLVDVAHKALEARLQSTGKECLIKESKAMMQRLSTNKIGPASNSAVLFTTAERPVCTHSTSVIVDVHQVASNEPCRQFGGETALATAVADAAYCQLTKTRSSLDPSVTQKHTHGLVEEAYQRTVAPERTMLKPLDQPAKCPREDGISTAAVAPDRYPFKIPVLIFAY